MSLVIGVNLSKSDLYVIADSIVTSSAPIHPVEVTRTSYGERIQPVTDGKGSVTYYAESACKFGVLNDTTIFGAATSDTRFLFSILRLFWNSRDIITTEQSIYDHGRRICTSLGGGTFAPLAQANLIFAIPSFLVSIDFVVTLNGAVELGFESSNTHFHDPKQFQRGSGAELIRQFVAQDILDASRNDPSLLSIGTSMLAMAFSSKMRTELRGQAAGIGGAFFGAHLCGDRIFYPKDTVFISANPCGIIQYFTQVTYRQGIFFVHELMGHKPEGERLLVMPTLNTFLEWEEKKQVPRAYVNEVANHARFLCDKLVLLDRRKLDYPERPNVRIYEADDGDSVMKMDFDRTKGIPYAIRDTKLEINGEEFWFP